MLNKAFLSRASLYGLVLLSFIYFPLASGDQTPYWLHEHFFNTVQILQGKMLQTNDISPIWGGLLYGFLRVFKTTDFSFFAAVYITLALLGILTLYLMGKLLEKLEIELSNIGKFTVYAFALTLYLQTAISGTDAALAIPTTLLFALSLLNALSKPSVLKALLSGLLLTMCVLVRFDSLGFAITFALVFYFQFNGKQPVDVKSFVKLIIGFAIGALPLIALWVWERKTFGSIIPSGLRAWNQMQGVEPWKMLEVLLWEPIRHIRQIPAAVALTTFPVLLIALTAYHSFPWNQREQNSRDTIFYSLLWFPIFQITMLSIFTYILVPQYAYYSLAIGTPIALGYAINRITANIESRDSAIANRAWIAIGLCAISLGFYIPLRAYDSSYGKAAAAIEQFSQQHTGLYAMSNGAGIVSFKSGQQFVRLDGLAADNQMLAFLGSQEDLDKVLASYGVDYYVAVNSPKEQGCYSARDPKQNRFGTNKSFSGWLCKEPMETLTLSPTLTVQIFDVRKNLHYSP